METEIKCPTCDDEMMTISGDSMFCPKCGMWLRHAWVTETAKKILDLLTRSKK